MQERSRDWPRGGISDPRLLAHTEKEYMYNVAHAISAEEGAESQSRSGQNGCRQSVVPCRGRCFVHTGQPRSRSFGQHIAALRISATLDESRCFWPLLNHGSPLQHSTLKLFFSPAATPRPSLRTLWPS